VKYFKSRFSASSLAGHLNYKLKVTWLHAQNVDAILLGFPEATYFVQLSRMISASSIFIVSLLTQASVWSA
jgi:hypothetical protein